jgi:hypothetical protein
MRGRWPCPARQSLAEKTSSAIFTAAALHRRDGVCVGVERDGDGGVSEAL